MTSTPAPRQEYALSEGPFELDRLRLLEQIYDPTTFAHLDSLDVQPGWSCLEVGAGAGSVARELARRVGPRGRVVATELSPSLLADLQRDATINARRHDILSGPPEPGAFDIVHARLVLEHLADPIAALRALFDATRPGGWILVEDTDKSSSVTVQASPAFQALRDALMQHLRNEGYAPDLGRRLPLLLSQIGATDVRAEGIVRLITPRHRADHGREMYRYLTAQLSERMARSGIISHRAIEAGLQALDDDDIVLMGSVLVSASARRPARD